MRKLYLFLRLLRPLLHVGLMGLIFWGAYLLRLHTDLIPGVQMRIPPIITTELIIYACCSAGVFVAFGFLRHRYPLFKSPAQPLLSFFKIRSYWLVTITFIAYFGQGLVFSSGISRLIIAWSAFFVLCMFPLLDFLFRKIAYPDREKILVLYDKKENLTLVQHKRKRAHLSSDACQIDEVTAGSLFAYTKIILVGSIAKARIESVFDTIRGHDISLYHIADSFFLEDIVYQSEHIHGVLAFKYTASTLDERAIISKRCVDLLGGIGGLILLSPVFLLIGIAIKCNSRGPIFYLQQRVGRAGKLFTFIKFRSMFLTDCVGEGYGGKQAWDKRQHLINSDANVRKGELQKIANDPRVTRVGAFLRKTSLDELPNLFSVVRGTMSLIGPRPHMAHEIAQYKPRQKRLLSIKPGITGYAQIHGRDALSFDDEANYDLYYIQNRSLFLDIAILFLTVKVVVKGR